MSGQEQFYRPILDSIVDGVYVCDTERRLIFWNQGAERITGYSAGEVLGSSCADNILVHVDEHGSCLCNGPCPVAATLADGRSRQVQAFLHHKAGHRVPVRVATRAMYGPGGEVQSVVESFGDNSELIDALERLGELSLESETDMLTGVGNRRSMIKKLQAFLDLVGKRHGRAGVLFIDIDRFKDINDTYAHEAGDGVLRMVANTLRENLRASDILARWGGEDFVALLYRVGEKNLAATAEKLRALVASSFAEFNGSTLRATVSVGATLVRPGDSVQSVVSRADALQYESKTGGRNRVTLAA